MTEPLWGGRFSAAPADPLRAFADSISFDVRLWEADLAATRAHAQGLADAGILTADEVKRIESAIDEAGGLFASGSFSFDAADEDIHSAVERFLTAKLGDLGEKIHAGRSRNDLVVTDLRLWLKPQISAIAKGVHELQEGLYRLAREHLEAIMPGYTHLQRAQPVALSHILLAHGFALGRDFRRLIAAYRHTDVSGLGAAALAGTSVPLDPPATAKRLGFAKVFDNAADAVADRDFALEFLAAGSILATHLSRLCEEVVLWTSTEFGFARLDDAYSTGSSIMPQKKNPDVAELSRGKAPRLLGRFVQLSGVLKGLPLTYNRDLQEDKECLFDAVDTLILMLAALKGMFATMSFDLARMRAACADGFLTATDLAERLVLQGVPFRQAHHAVGKCVAEAAARGVALEELDPGFLEEAQPGLASILSAGLTVDDSVASRDTHGGTSPHQVEAQLARLEALLDDEERWLAGFGAW